MLDEDLGHVQITAVLQSTWVLELRLRLVSIYLGADTQGTFLAMLHQSDPQIGRAKRHVGGVSWKSAYLSYFAFSRPYLHRGVYRL
jgi:hypothetical protein